MSDDFNEHENDDIMFNIFSCFFESPSIDNCGSKNDIEVSKLRKSVTLPIS